MATFSVKTYDLTWPDVVDDEREHVVVDDETMAREHDLVSQLLLVWCEAFRMPIAAMRTSWVLSAREIEGGARLEFHRIGGVLFYYGDILGDFRVRGPW